MTSFLSLPLPPKFVSSSVFLTENPEIIINLKDLKKLYNENIRSNDKPYQRILSYRYPIEGNPIPVLDDEISIIPEMNDTMIKEVYVFIYQCLTWIETSEYKNYNKTQKSSVFKKVKCFEYTKNIEFYLGIYKLCHYLLFSQDILNYLKLCIFLRASHFNSDIYQKYFITSGVERDNIKKRYEDFHPDYHITLEECNKYFDEVTKDMKRNTECEDCDSIGCIVYWSPSGNAYCADCENRRFFSREYDDEYDDYKF
jgi:hypothetical protein